MENENNIKVDYRAVYKAFMKKKKYFFITLPIAFILSCIYILSIPRYYTTDTKLAPELHNSNPMSSLGSLASTFGVDLANMKSEDAITPIIYPELMDDYGFVTGLWGIRVADQTDSIKTTYYDYLKNRQKTAWWTPAIEGFLSLFKSEDKEADAPYKENQNINPYKLTKKQDEVVKAIQQKVNFSFDKKTYVITVSVQDQDPLICKTIADTVTTKLRQFITEYRTSKARKDVAHYQELSDKAKAEYEKIRDQYVRFADANNELILESVKAKLEDMENEMQLKYNAYTSIQTQLQIAKAKLQERTPAFTILKGAEVPVKPAGPKRMIFVAVMLLLTFMGTSVYILHNILKKQ